jgi:thiamine pyrophosphate-dependent acetolactate synthase large subunit-like protein
MPTALTPRARYDQIVSAFGGKGYLVETRDQLRGAFADCLADRNHVSLINVMISSNAGRKTQVDCFFSATVALMNDGAECHVSHFVRMM